MTGGTDFARAIEPTAPSGPRTCPGCTAPMRPVALARKPVGECTVDLCSACQAIWFDAFESTQLTPGAVLALFDAIRNVKPTARTALPARLPCVRCAMPLALTHDLQHATRFTYYRCEYGHGRFTPFVEFLREKDFIRPLPPEELERLRGALRTIHCASCGAPIDLATMTACSYCHAPLSMLDPDAIAKTINELRSAESRPAADPARIAEAIIAAQRMPAGTQYDTSFATGGAPIAFDLIAAGIACVADFLSS